jgi:hypothetical protein
MLQAGPMEFTLPSVRVSVTAPQGRMRVWRYRNPRRHYPTACYTMTAAASGWRMSPLTNSKSATRRHEIRSSYCMHSSLSVGLSTVNALLNSFAKSDRFWDQLTAVFGPSYKTAAAVDLRQQWQTGNMGEGPAIRVVSEAALAGASAAYASELDAIFLSRSFLATASQAAIVRVLLEEIGHGIDARINRVDTPGDEGERFAHMLLGHPLTQAERNRMGAEDDHASLVIEGRLLLVEKAEPLILSVTTELDERDGSALIGSGLSLRDAILIANQNPATDYEIRLPGGVIYELRSSGFPEDNGIKGDLDIKARTGSLAIVSSGDVSATINASNLSIGDRIFHVLENGRLSLQSLVLRGGNTSGDGGAIRVESGGELLIADAEITANATTGDGGAIANLGTVIGDNVRITANRSTGGLRAGGVYNNGDMMLRHSSVSANTGRGIYNFETLQLIGSTISNNSDDGIRLSLASVSGFVNTTISGNQGIGIDVSDSSLVLNSCTITRNFSDFSFDAAGIENNGGIVSLRNSIVAGNINTSGGPADLRGEFEGDGNNLIGSLQGAVGSVGTGSDLVSANPGLAPLADNGGLVQTHALLLNSPAINAGNNLLLVNDDEDLDLDGDVLEPIPFDARGAGFVRNRWGVVDIGAFESPLQPGGLPVIALSLRAAIAAEDSGRFVFTFSRTGSTLDPQVVQFSVGGTASSGSDYADLNPAGSIKSVTIAAGSASATLAIRPIADATTEANETLSLRLATNSLYRIGTATAVTGTIVNDDFIGTAASESITGSGFADNIDGLAGADVLTGLAGADLFRFRFSQSTVSAPDRITDFTFGTDKIKPLSSTGASLALPVLSRAQDDTTSATLSQLCAKVFADANGALVGLQPLSAAGAALVVATAPAIAGTYLLINDGTAAFNVSNDTLINLTGFQGTLPALGSIAPNLLFG